MRRRMYIEFLAVLWSSLALAAPHYSTAYVTHWLGVSVMGYEANPILSGSEAYTKAGGGGSVALLYELHRSHFFFNIGVGADYSLTNIALDNYADAFPRVDYTGEAMTYRYVYSDWQEQQSRLSVVVPVQFGYRFGSYFYTAIGAAFRTTPLQNKFSSVTQMLTEGEYGRFIQPIREAPDYGYWEQEEYRGAGIVKSATHEMAVNLELGARVPLYYGIHMRAGVYVGYDIPLIAYSARATTTPTDYSAVDINPFTQSQDNLAANLLIRSLLDTPVLSKEAQRISVGIKLTFIFNVTRESRKCMCDTD